MGIWRGLWIGIARWCANRLRELGAPYVNHRDLFPELLEVPKERHGELLGRAYRKMWNRNWWWIMTPPFALFATAGNWPRWGGRWEFFTIIICAFFLYSLVTRRLLSRLMRPHLLRILPGHCRNCGYDMRATPERCPECGKKVEKVIRNN